MPNAALTCGLDGRAPCCPPVEEMFGGATTSKARDRPDRQVQRHVRRHSGRACIPYWHSVEWYARDPEKGMLEQSGCDGKPAENSRSTFSLTILATRGSASGESETFRASPMPQRWILVDVRERAAEVLIVATRERPSGSCVLIQGALSLAFGVLALAVSVSF